MTRAWNADGKPRKPRILCIGAQKAGTSWLHHHLNAHPMIWTTPFKELHYFDARHCPDHRKWLPWHFRQAIRDTERRFAARGEEMPDDMIKYLLDMTSGKMFNQNWYRRAFAPAPQDALPLDTTPEYSTLPDDGLDDVADTLPNAKFIYLIRDPVDRAVSQLKMNLSRKKMLPGQPQGYLRHLDDPELVNRGDYASYLPRWQARFGPDRLLILPYGRIASDPLALMREVESFLKIPAHDYLRLGGRVHESGAAPAFPDEGRQILRRTFAGQYAYLNANFDTHFNAALG